MDEKIVRGDLRENVRSSKGKSGFLRTLRTVHGWLGIMVIPWVFIMGITGFYLNHSKAIWSAFPQAKYDESRFNQLKPTSPITQESALNLANSLWPDLPVKKIWEKEYHGWPSYYVRKGNARVILSIPTGHYYTKVRYARRTYTPQGVLVHTKIYWGRILKDLHETGWIGGSLGTWLADVFSIALIFFGLSGIIMWSTPRVRKWKRSSQQA